MTTLADKVILSGADNRPPMLEKDMYDSWKSIMELYMMNRQHGRMILESVENGPLIWPSIEENGVTRPNKYSELSATEAIQADCDIKATNIILQGLPPEVYVLFTYKKGKTLRDFYLRFSLLLNDMNIYNMKLEQFQVNTEFLNTLPPEWSKFMTDVNLILDLHTTNIDQLHAYLGQHEFHANEMTQSPYQTHQKSYQNSQFQPHVSHYLSQQYSINQSSTPLSITHPSNDYHSSVHHNAYSLSSSIPKLEYAPTINQQQQQPEFSQSDLGLIQELLTHISKTCPSVNNTDGKLVVVTPKNKDKRVRFTDPVTSLGYTITKTASTSNQVSNKPMSSSIGVKPSTSACGSQPSGNTKKDKKQQTSSSTQKNKVEAHPRKVESSFKNKDYVVKPKGTAKCNGCMLSDNHDLCVLDFINNVNARNKS
ncbi:hypothetical protein Tco_1151296, partial [Tanacetum coccineum]